ncbi:hypothetical protein LNKW23_12860 [Paralimibaculum aggregatum]|uniref:Uncharacterized protein n=1 Tax=Paralimibaculum aggregatum TaxID=3036245 RepID=A0ABQ6LML2_9RHOB|nr:hypothetical protein [Limibaculum sp. NKW23]GMG82073.1 hypothetical protein LNKW23_12860 [Limibaculum sp. NKW23]
MERQHTAAEMLLGMIPLATLLAFPTILLVLFGAVFGVVAHGAPPLRPPAALAAAPELPAPAPAAFAGAYSAAVAEAVSGAGA